MPVHPELPVLFTGGLAHGAKADATEAEIAQRIARRDYGATIRWAETRSRDTDENAHFSVSQLRAEGIERIVLVTHTFHMQRAMAAFARAGRRTGSPMQVVAAPLGFRSGSPWGLTAWLPSAEGFR